MNDDSAVREHVSRLLDWEDAHVSFDKAVEGIPESLHSQRPSNLPYSLWQLVEHLRRAQHDILEFCRNPDYRELRFPDDYWPASATPPSSAAWHESIRQVREDREALQRLAVDPKVDLTARVPHGSGQTYLRELLLVADHTAYHVGELVMVRRLLGIWKSA
jgi:uncharacterized damage-inducible protein DinB